MSYDLDTMSPDDPNWPKRPDGSPMPKGAAAAFLRGQGQQATASGGARRSKSDGPDDNYVEVKERIQAFYAAYPTGAIMTTKVKLLEYVGDQPPKVMVQAKAYRTPDDPHPGVGTSWLNLPGRTPYTNGSEVENAETSAWGRAIAAVGILVDRGIASAQEIKMKAGGEIEPPSRTNAEALARAAEAAASAGGSEPVSMPGAGAPAPEQAAEVVPVSDASAPEATETAAEPATAPEAAAEAEGQGKATGEAPAAKDVVVDTRMPEEVMADNAAKDAPADGLSYDEFKRLAREKFIPNASIAQTARRMVEQGALRETGGVRELTDSERLALLMVAMADIDEAEQDKDKE